MAKSKKKNKDLDDYHWHEAVDRADMIACILEEQLMAHPVIEKNEDLYEIAETAQNALWELYQAIGLKRPHD
jgi:hypothetical protein